MDSARSFLLEHSHSTKKTQSQFGMLAAKSRFPISLSFLWSHVSADGNLFMSACPVFELPHLTSRQGTSVVGNVTFLRYMQVTNAKDSLEAVFTLPTNYLAAEQVGKCDMKLRTGQVHSRLKQ